MINNIYGQWRIVEMQEYDEKYVDAEVPAYINFDNDSGGEFQFGYVHGFMDCYFTQGGEMVDFSWEGNDEMDDAFGRGNATLKDGKLYGTIFFHYGDSASFIAIRLEK
ncbi:MAG TPA: hypothetical protein ENK21_06960 [Trueperaceae bacterium]|nr:hypothetical protein [Trueperaceae bacterium]